MSNRFGTSVRRLAMACTMAALGLAGGASATLLDRGPDLVYDNVLNITWTRQAGDGVQRTWADANAWAANLEVDGFKGWRLPYASVVAGAGFQIPIVDCSTNSELACRDNEMGYMYYQNQGGSSGDDKTGTQTALGGQQLTRIQPGFWSGTEADSGVAWYFGFGNGFQNSVDEHLQLPAWAVHPGDVAAVPEPATVLLIGVGMLGLVWARSSRRRR
jgi:hypothetical protein